VPRICKRRKLVAVVRHLGIYVSLKQVNPPSEVMRFLGIEIDSKFMELWLPLDKFEKLKAKLLAFLSKR
jgi:hypothetical protein